MNELQLVNQSKSLDSREVAEMVGKEHKNLLRDINNYVNILLSSNLSSIEFFSESTYEDSIGRTLPCYKVTKKGCEMIANKLTGKKGVLFTAAYVTKFNKMEHQQPLPQLTQTQIIAALAQQQVVAEQKMIELESRTDNVERRLTLVKDTMAERNDNWRSWVNVAIGKIAKSFEDQMLAYQKARTESYQLLEERAGCDLDKRLKNLKLRLAQEGICKSKIKQANYLDVIEAEPRLKEIYSAIVKEMTIKYVA
jgi:phage regulatory protein, rha family